MRIEPTVYTKVSTQSYFPGQVVHGKHETTTLALGEKESAPLETFPL